MLDASSDDHRSAPSPSDETPGHGLERLLKTTDDAGRAAGLPDGSAPAVLVAGAVTLATRLLPGALRPLLRFGSVGAVFWLLRRERARLAAAEAHTRTLEERLHEHEAYLLGASHELRSPLGKATMALQYVLDGTDDAHRSIGQAALFELHRLMVTLENMLELARMRSGEATINVQDVDVVELVRQRVRAAEGDEAGHTLILDAPDEVPGFQTDPARLAQIMDNLISNAIKYSPEQSEVRVRVTATSKTVTVAVRDHGVGIRPEERQRIFEQYYRSTNGGHVSGVGLGLFITRALVESLSGRLDVQSRVGAGSEFRVALPRQSTASAPTALAPSA